jgi:16S rRNA (guanine1207-N2)-methyltransferase
MSEIVLGNERRAGRMEALRGGALCYRSAHGLKPAARVLIEALPKSLPARLLTGFDSQAAVALAVGALHPEAAITHVELDRHLASQARQSLARNGCERVHVAGGADLPGIVWPEELDRDGEFAGEPFGAVLLTFPATGDALLARELLEETQLVLAPGGLLLAATDNVKGTWLQDTIKDLFGRCDITRREPRHGIALMARRTREKPRLKDRRHRFALRVGERELLLTSRPGVFSHARIDQGTKALLATVPIATGERVLDLGCGYGPLGLCAAVRAAPAPCVLVDSSYRAASLAEQNARLNDLANVKVMGAARPDALPRGAFDLVLANPPYFSNYRIAHLFAATAWRVLAVGGRLAMVAKEREHHTALVTEVFGHCEVIEDRGYRVFQAVKRDEKPRRPSRRP